jgi:anti-sigma-K factor RskA
MRQPRLSADEFHELAIAHLLGELDIDGQAAFAAELAHRGPEGRQMVRRLARTLGEVALAAAPTEPPPRVRSRVLSALPTGADRAAAPSADRTRWPWWAAAVLGVVALSGLGLWRAQLAGERNRLRGAVERLEASAAAGDDARAELGAVLADLDLAAAPGSTVYGLEGGLALPQSGGRVFVDTIAGRALLLASGLPRLDPDESFALWSIGEEGTRAVTVFRPDENGRVRREIADVAPLHNARTLAVTVEPASGVAEPGGEIVLSSERF